eukprot:2085090-Amphidinium_carterae.1
MAEFRFRSRWWLRNMPLFGVSREAREQALAANSAHSKYFVNNFRWDCSKVVEQIPNTWHKPGLYFHRVFS